MIHWGLSPQIWFNNVENRPYLKPQAVFLGRFPQHFRIGFPCRGIPPPERDGLGCLFIHLGCRKIGYPQIQWFVIFFPTIVFVFGDKHDNAEHLSREWLEWEKVHVPQIQWLVISSTMLEHLNVEIRPSVFICINAPYGCILDTPSTQSDLDLGCSMF